MTRSLALPFLLTMTIAFVLQFLPLPYWLGTLRPLWVPLVLTAWLMIERTPAGLLVAWITGLLLDAAYGVALGQHALVLTLVAYVALQLRSALSVLPAMQAALALTPMWLGYVLLLVWMDSAQSHTADVWQRWVPLLTTALIWPFVAALIRDIVIRYRPH